MQLGKTLVSWGLGFGRSSASDIFRGTHQRTNSILSRVRARASDLDGAASIKRRIFNLGRGRDSRQIVEPTAEALPLSLRMPTSCEALQQHFSGAPIGRLASDIEAAIPADIAQTDLTRLLLAKALTAVTQDVDTARQVLGELATPQQMHPASAAEKAFRSLGATPTGRGLLVQMSGLDEPSLDRLMIKLDVLEVIAAEQARRADQPVNYQREPSIAERALRAIQAHEAGQASAAAADDWAIKAFKNGLRCNANDSAFALADARINKVSKWMQRALKIEDLKKGNLGAALKRFMWSLNLRKKTPFTAIELNNHNVERGTHDKQCERFDEALRHAVVNLADITNDDAHRGALLQHHNDESIEACWRRHVHFALLQHCAALSGDQRLDGHALNADEREAIKRAVVESLHAVDPSIDANHLPRLRDEAKLAARLRKLSTLDAFLHQPITLERIEAIGQSLKPRLPVGCAASFDESFNQAKKVLTAQDFKFSRSSPSKIEAINHHLHIAIDKLCWIGTSGNLQKLTAVEQVRDCFSKSWNRNTVLSDDTVTAQLKSLPKAAVMYALLRHCAPERKYPGNPPAKINNRMLLEKDLPAIARCLICDMGFPNLLEANGKPSDRLVRLMVQTLKTHQPFKDLIYAGNQTKMPITLDRIEYFYSQIFALCGLAPEYRSEYENAMNQARQAAAKAGLPSNGDHDESNKTVLCETTLRAALQDVVDNIEQDGRIRLEGGGSVGFNTKAVGQQISVWNPFFFTVKPEIAGTLGRQAVIEIARSSYGIEVFLGTQKSSETRIGAGVALGKDFDIAGIRLGRLNFGSVHLMAHAYEKSSARGVILRVPMPSQDTLTDAASKAEAERKMKAQFTDLLDEILRTDSPKTPVRKLTRLLQNIPDLSVSWIGKHRLGDRWIDKPSSVGDWLKKMSRAPKRGAAQAAEEPIAINPPVGRHQRGRRRHFVEFAAGVSVGINNITAQLNKVSGGMSLRNRFQLTSRMRQDNIDGTGSMTIERAHTGWGFNSELSASLNAGAKFPGGGSGHVVLTPDLGTIRKEWLSKGTSHRRRLVYRDGKLDRQCSYMEHEHQSFIGLKKSVQSSWSQWMQSLGHGDEAENQLNQFFGNAFAHIGNTQTFNEQWTIKSSIADQIDVLNSLQSVAAAAGRRGEMKHYQQRKEFLLADQASWEPSTIKIYERDFRKADKALNFVIQGGSYRSQESAAVINRLK